MPATIAIEISHWSAAMKFFKPRCRETMTEGIPRSSGSFESALPVLKRRLAMLYWTLRALLFLLRLIPDTLLLLMGRFFGWFWYYLLPIRRRVMLENLAQAFKTEKSPAEIRAIARRTCTHLVLNIIEMLQAPVKLSAQTLGRYVDFSDYKRIQSICERRGVLVLTAHFGNWDLLCQTSALIGVRLGVITRPFSIKAMARLYEDYRTQFGLTVIPAHNSALKIWRLLDKGYAIGFVLDQHAPPSSGVHVPFFGRPACTTNGLALLAQKTHAPVIPAFLVRKGFWKHRLVVFDPIPFPDIPDSNQAVAEATRQYTAVIEQMVRQYPDQWTWVHRRWKSQPTGTTVCPPSP